MSDKEIYIFRGKVLQTKKESNCTIIYLTDTKEYLSSYIEDNYKDLEDFVNSYKLFKKLSNYHKELLTSSGLDTVAEYITDNLDSSNNEYFPYLTKISQDVLYHYTTSEIMKRWRLKYTKAANSIAPFPVDFINGASLFTLFASGYNPLITDLLGYFQWLEFVREDEKFDYRHRIKLLIKDKEGSLLIQAFTDIDYGA